MTTELSVAVEQKRFRIEKVMFGKFKKLHFVGIGGAGMSGIAEILLNLGFTVTGSDNTPSEITDYLETLGLNLHSNHDSSNLESVDVVIISSAISPDNPEVQEAHRRGIPVIKRAEMLGELMRLKFSIGVAGTHGKTTTTSMIGKILTSANYRPTLIVGGVVAELGTGASLGDGDYLIAEADEYDKSFLAMYPSVAVVLNIEQDHFDCYDSMDDLKNSFLTYINKVPFYGSAVIAADDHNIAELIPHITRPHVTFGFSDNADYQATSINMENGVSTFTVLHKNNLLGVVQLKVPGKHNISNALAAIATAIELEVPFDVIAESLKEFSGVGRRFEICGEFKDVLLIDDYAHHPTEIKATLETVKDNYDRRVIAIFQPHLYSRTRDFLSDFADTLSIVDHCILTDIYPAREKPIEGITSETILKNAKSKGYNNFSYVGKKVNAVDELMKHARPNDLVILIGAGSITHLRQPIIERLNSL